MFTYHNWLIILFLTFIILMIIIMSSIILVAKKLNEKQGSRTRWVLGLLFMVSFVALISNSVDMFLDIKKFEKIPREVSDVNYNAIMEHNDLETEESNVFNKCTLVRTEKKLDLITFIHSIKFKSYDNVFVTEVKDVKEVTAEKHISGSIRKLIGDDNNVIVEVDGNMLCGPQSSELLYLDSSTVVDFDIIYDKSIVKDNKYYMSYRIKNLKVVDN